SRGVWQRMPHCIAVFWYHARHPRGRLCPAYSRRRQAMALLERIESKLKWAMRERRYAAMLDEALARARSAGPDAALSPRDLFADAPDDYWFWLHTEGRRQRPALLDLLPGLPPPEVQERFTGNHGDATLTEAFGAFQLFREAAERAGT